VLLLVVGAQAAGEMGLTDPGWSYIQNAPRAGIGILVWGEVPRATRSILAADGDRRSRNRYRFLGHLRRSDNVRGKRIPALELDVPGAQGVCRARHRRPARPQRAGLMTAVNTLVPSTPLEVSQP